MANFVDLPTVGTVRLDHTLERAVQASWHELMAAATAGSIQVEYRVESDGTLQYLKIWTSPNKGAWRLICEQWTTTAWSHVPGLQFSTGYYSEALAHFLEIVARHQNAFITASGIDRYATLQISRPTEDESRAAQLFVADVIAVLGATPVEQLVTAWTQAPRKEVEAD